MKKWWVALEDKKIYFYCLLIGIITFYPFTKTGILINDDLQTSIMARSKSFFRVILDFWQLNTTQGRTNFFGGVFYYIPFAFSNFTYFKFVQLGFILLDLILLAYLFKLILKSKAVFFMTLLLSLLFLQNSWEHNPVTSFPGQFAISCAIFLLSLIFYVKYLYNNKFTYIIMSSIGYLIVLFSYELYAVYFPVFLLLHLFINKKITIKKLLPLFIAVALYITCYVLFRLSVGSSYGGAQVDGTFNVINMFKVIWQYSISSFPTYFLFNDKYQYLMYIYSDSLLAKSFPDIIGNILHSLRIEWIIKALLVFVTSVTILKWPKEKVLGNHSKRAMLAFCFIAICYIFIPAILLSVTSQYQVSVIQYGTLGMPVSYYAFLSVVVALTLIIKVSLELIKSEVVRNVVIVLVSILLVAGGLMVDFTNYYISKYQGMAHYKWETVDRFLGTQEFLSLADHSTIYSPTLFTQAGSLFIHDSYWADYIKAKTGKDIYVLNSEPVTKSDNLYYIKYSQSAKENEQNLVFYKINELQNSQSLTNQIYVYNFSSYDELYVLGRINLQSDNHVITLNGQSVELKNDLYQLRLTNNQYIVDHDLKKTVITGEGLYAASITIINEPSALVDINN